MANQITTLEEAKNELGITKWSEFKPTTMLPQFAEMIARTDPTIISEMIKNLPQLMDFYKTVNANAKEANSETINAISNGDSAVDDASKKLLDAIYKKLDSPDVSDEMFIKLVQEANQRIDKDGERALDKIKTLFENNKLFQYGSYALAGLVVGVGGYLLGKKPDIKFIKK